MLKSYFLLAYRNIIKNKLTAFINIFGLSVAIGCMIVAYLFLDFYFNRDDFHENADRIFLVENVISGAEGQQVWGDSPIALGPALVADFPQVEKAVRIADGSARVRYQEKLLYERLRFVDQSFLEIFSFQVKAGESAALQQRNKIVISEAFAEKYFVQGNPVGKEMRFDFGNQHKEVLVVGAVLEKLPSHASFKFDVLVNYQIRGDLIGNVDEWQTLTTATFIQLQENADISTLNGQMGKYLALQNAASEDRPMAQIMFESLPAMAENSPRVRNSIVSIQILRSQVISMAMTGIFILMLACFNYMNIAIVSASRRLKEIGIRKVVGGNRRQLIYQFITENIFLCLGALILGVLVADNFLVPGFNSLWGVFNLELIYADNAPLWLFFLALLIVTGVGAGAYPAFYISKFQPVGIFRDKLRFNGKNRLTRILLTLQFILSFNAIVMSVVFWQNGENQKTRDWGYQQAQVLVLPLEKASDFVPLKNEIESLAGVENLAGADNHIARSSGQAVVNIAGEPFEIAKFDVGFNYLETLGIRLVNGRFFDELRQSDSDAAVVINQTFAREMAWDDALDRKITYNNRQYRVIGVVEDFHYNSFMQKVEPLILRVVPEGQFNYLVVKLEGGNINTTAAAINDIWKKQLPDTPYSGFFQDDVFERYFQAMDGISQSASFNAALALLITCMGIFGLVSLTIARRRKEISIRKVLGAGTMHIANLINRSFVVLMIIAAIISLPINYFAATLFLDALFEYHIAVDGLPFIIAFLLILFTALLTIGAQIYKAVVANPVHALRSE